MDAKTESRTARGLNRDITLQRPAIRRAEGTTSSLPPDLQAQVRGRLQILAILMTIGFAFDPSVFFITWGVNLLTGTTPSPEFLASLPFQWMNIATVAASLALLGIVRHRSVPSSLMHPLGSVYEVLICFVIALTTTWQYYIQNGILPNLTWVPAVVILFPLVLPGSPRATLAAAIVAAAMSPLALWLLELAGKVSGDSEGYTRTWFSSVLAVAFAYMGSRVVYRLRREVAAARELGSYRLEEKLGEGGMGEVWRARHHMLARPAAIKLIRESLTTDGRRAAARGTLERFEREAQVIAGLRSPHTVDLFDFGLTDDGILYYVMELLDGLDAERLVRKFGPMPPERVVHLLRQVCHSLSEADSRGLVHRDIKPANIFLCRYGEEDDFVKVLDFGLVKTFEERVEGVTQLSGENSIQGTPAFMAPEQILGASELDGRVDIYSTGCVAYWLLTGQLVFSADTPMSLLMHHVQTAPEPPSARVEWPIPESLDRIVMSCLEKNPAARPQSARELSQQLALIDSGSPWTANRAREWWEKNRPVPAQPAMVPFAS